MAVRPIREQMIIKAGECMVCGASPKRPHRHLPAELSQLCVHEILNGPLRSKTMSEACATLVVCWRCNEVLNDKKLWPPARQLAVLLHEAPEEYDLERFLKLAGKPATAITQEEVTAFWQHLYR